MTMTASIIGLCWAIFVVYWGIAALRVKRTIKRRSDWLRAAILVIVVFGAALLRSRFGREFDSFVLPRTLPVRVVADVLAAVGVAILVWARTILGGNWSGAVTLKENHELIQHGPYAYVRHPIYSGLMLLGLATAIHYATLGGFVLLALIWIGFVLKMREEELLMTEHFPDRYPAYRARVKAIVPFVV
jgi:protein-S-isoprenylcysteine O-methyltransferase Ste14